MILILVLILFLVMLWVASKTYDKKTKNDIFPSRWPLLALFIMNFVPEIAIFTYVVLAMWWCYKKWVGDYIWK